MGRIKAFSLSSRPQGVRVGIEDFMARSVRSPFQTEIKRKRKFMKRQIRFLCIGVLICSLALGTWVCRSAAEEVTKDMCLGCHGPFDKLAGAAAKYEAPSGEKINPHQYVPHTSKEAKAIAECGNCHESHPTPPTAADIAKMGKPGVDWCYTTCHHQNDFAPCTKCHNK